jgi:hypothetical protein
VSVNGKLFDTLDDDERSDEKLNVWLAVGVGVGGGVRVGVGGGVMVRDKLALRVNDSESDGAKEVVAVEVGVGGGVTVFVAERSGELVPEPVSVTVADIVCVSVAGSVTVRVGGYV